MMIIFTSGSLYLANGCVISTYPTLAIKYVLCYVYKPPKKLIASVGSMALTIAVRTHRERPCVFVGADMCIP
jgi:hypothetical protein